MNKQSEVMWFYGAFFGWRLNPKLFAYASSFRGERLLIRQCANMLDHRIGENDVVCLIRKRQLSGIAFDSLKAWGIRGGRCGEVLVLY